MTSIGGPYLWEQPVWPDGLTWSPVAAALAGARRMQGRLLAKASLVGLRDRAALEATAYEEEALFTSQIEGERLDRDSVRSSVAWQLGLDRGGASRQRQVDGLVAVLLDATRNARMPVTLERLCGWQAALFPTGFSGPHRIAVGTLRTGAEPMRVVSGAWGQPTVHFEAPPSDALPEQIRAFLEWLEAPTQEDGFIRAGLVHLRFVTLHPFDDGNGRVTRALTDLVLARDDDSPTRLSKPALRALRAG